MITVGTSECVLGICRRILTCAHWVSQKFNPVYTNSFYQGFIDATEAELVDCDSNMSLVIKSGAPIIRHCSFSAQGDWTAAQLR